VRDTPTRPHRIAIVEDDESERAALLNLFASMGLPAVAFPTAEAFLDSRWVEQTACLVLDVQMPGMGGLGLQEHLGASGHHIPTIFISAYLDYTVCARALRGGAVCFLMKPLTEDELLQGLRSAMAAPTDAPMLSLVR
jgi:FixJ family two-component response regulator